METVYTDFSKSFKMMPFFIGFGEKTNLKLLVYEYVSGGGFADKSIPSGILSEGFGMLRMLISDLKAAGHSVTAVLDSRLAMLSPPTEADCVVPVSSLKEAETVIHSVSESADAAYMIAPESNQLLQSFVEGIEQTGVPSLNCRASAIERVSDKAKLLDSVKKMGLPTPATIMVNALEDVAEIKRTISSKFEFPLIFKPVDGAGCGGLSVVRSENQVTSAVEKVTGESSNRYFMVQELIRGIAVSVSLISTGSEALPISLNKQDISLTTPGSTSTYNGGQAPFNSQLKREAFATAETIVGSFRGLRGYIGVDLVLTKRGPVVIEVNPRLTTSYVGVRRVISFNPAQAIINSIFDRELPVDNQSVGYALFSKVNTPTPTTEALQKTYRMAELVSPPFPVSCNGTACALLLSQHATLKEATTGFREAKKRLLSITAGGK
jgi:predicted ATP-grasp superfamily ATP-dependent carboligase